jgi:hypothetical protein
MKTLALILLAACSSPSHGPNLVVEGLKDHPEKPACEPYFTDMGDRHVHTAKCTLADKSQAYCVLNVDTLGIACGPLVQQPMQHAQGSAGR